MAEKETRAEIPQTPINETGGLELFRDLVDGLPHSGAVRALLRADGSLPTAGSTNHERVMLSALDRWISKMRLMGL